MAILRPVRKSAVYHYDRRTGLSWPDSVNETIIMEAVCYYQSASYLFSHQLNREIKDFQQGS